MQVSRLWSKLRSGIRCGSELLASTGADSLTIIWDGVTEQRLMTLAGHTGPVISPAFLLGERLVTSSYDGSVRIWDISRASDHEAPASFEDTKGKMYTSIAYSSDGARLAVSGGSTPGEIVDANTGRTLISLGGKFSNWQGSTAFSPDGALLATTSGEENAYVWDAASGKKLRTLTGHRDWIGDLAFSPDGKRLATISFDGTAKMWDPASGRELFSIQALTGPGDTVTILGIDFSPDGSRFATAGDYTPKIWDALTGIELLALPEQAELTYSVAFSPDGGRLAVGVSYTVGASIWDATTGKKLADLLGHQGSVQAILFSRDGKQVFTGSVDGTIKVWNAATGQEQLTLTRQSAQITGLALSPDGTRLAASSDNGTARVYLLPIEDLVEVALSRLTRWFTPQECLEYLHTDTCPVMP